ncbi:lipopolysaccharide-induced tumor necrosis factor-alpha factor homolog isoform X2 [Rhynchophorus ferrugineus]|uniref:LITAF domain-containing protein n=1 Tax=Rhynchophorus ferrugineus TaxID=354439 RepID=A0A834M5M4_RHYFE|nr:hypothetical protein GWI33_019078 [Rhynchophorus ferrugineus]
MEKQLPPPYSIKDPLLNSEMCPSYLPPPSQEMCDTIAYPPPDLGMYIPRAYPSPSAPPSLPQPVHQHVEMPTQQTKQLVIITLPESPAIYGPSPISTRCPRCRNLITTAVRTKPTIKTHLFALLLCALGCWLCCFFPYCIDSCQSKKHFCTICKAYLAESVV